MRIIQLLPTLSYGDAIGNDVLAMKKIIQEMGFDTSVYAEIIDNRLPSGVVRPFSEFPNLADNDVIVYHASTGTDLNYKLPQLGGRKLMIYHNITPPDFFQPYSPAAEQLAAYGLQGIKQLSDQVEQCLADSEFNSSNLRELGFTCPIDVCPILIPFRDYERTPNQHIIRKYREDGYVNLLFTGRIAPNKKQEDVIRAFYYYHTYHNPKSRLILVGSWNGLEKYYNRLCDYIKVLGITDSVIFPGHVKFNELVAYYKIADVFVCMSEHEGFCVPLVEAMYFDIPIIAYCSTAIPETLGGSGLLLENKDPKAAAAAIHQVIGNREFYQELVAGQRQRLENFSYLNVKKLFLGQLSSFLEKEGLYCKQSHL